MGKLRICRGFIALFLASSLPVLAGEVFDFYDLSELGACVKKIKKDPNEDLVMACPLPEFVVKVRAQNYAEPGKRFLVARLLVKALFTQHQTELLKETDTASSASTAAELFPNIPASRSQFMQYFFPDGAQENIQVLPPSKEAVFVSQTKNLVDEISFWLEPLREFKSVKKAKSDFLYGETAHLLFWTYGLSLRFDSLAQLIQASEKDLLSNRDFEQLYLSQVSQWIKEFGALPLRAWYAQKIQSKLPPMGGALSDAGWNYWIESLRLLDRPIPAEAKDTLLAQLRWLWIVSPEAKRNTEVEKLGDELGFSKQIDSWSVKNLSLQEYMWRVQALAGALSTRTADQMMEKLLKENAKLLTNKDEVWDALQLHIRLLKILDERTRIGKLIERYDEKFKFFEAPSDKADLIKHYERLYQLAVQFWTLEDNPHALQLLDRIDSYKSKEARALQLKVAYVRARMNEGNDLDLLKRTYKLDLRDDQKLEIGWRTFFKLFEGTPKQVAEGLAFIESNAAVFKRMGEYALKIDFWRAHAFSKLHKEKDALKIFNKGFSDDPYSFYGLMSALMVREASGKFPSGWEIPNKASGAPFREKTYLTADGYPGDEKNGIVARALVLAKARYFDRALAVLREAAGGRVWRSVASVDDQHARMRDITRLYVALGDKRSAMNLMTGLLAKKSDELNSEDWEFIFPRVFEKEIRKKAEARNLDPWVVSSIIRQESAFDPRARSGVDALGLMQLLPVTAQKEAKILGRKGFRPEDLYDPTVSIELGTSNVMRLLKVFDHSYICAFAAYNAGLPPIKNWLKTHGTQPLVFSERIPYKETRDYVKKLLRNFIMYRRLYEKDMPPLASLLAMPSEDVSDRIYTYEASDRIAQE